MIPVDYDEVDELLAAIKCSSPEPATGPFGNALADVSKQRVKFAKQGSGKPSEPELFQCLVKAVGQFEKTGETGDVWLTARDRKKAEKLNTWLVFGGVDKGPAPKE